MFTAMLTAVFLVILFDNKEAMYLSISIILTMVFWLFVVCIAIFIVLLIASLLDGYWGIGFIAICVCCLLEFFDKPKKEI